MRVRSAREFPALTGAGGSDRALNRPFTLTASVMNPSNVSPSRVPVQIARRRAQMAVRNRYCRPERESTSETAPCQENEDVSRETKGGVDDPEPSMQPSRGVPTSQFTGHRERQRHVQKTGRNAQQPSVKEKRKKNTQEKEKNPPEREPHPETGETIEPTGPTVYSGQEQHGKRASDDAQGRLRAKKAPNSNRRRCARGRRRCAQTLSGRGADVQEGSERKESTQKEFTRENLALERKPKGRKREGRDRRTVESLSEQKVEALLDRTPRGPYPSSQISCVKRDACQAG
jgi:hypothetical protein